MITIHKHIKTLAAYAISAALLAGCATNGAATIPSTTQANLSANALQVAVGTVNYGQEGSVGLNVVTTLRQPNGLSGVLADLPIITGPAGFTVPAGVIGAYTGTNVDAGTNHITGSPQVPRTQTPVNSTFGTFDGVIAYGIGPYNCDQTCTSLGAYYPGNPNNTSANGFLSSRYACGSVITRTSFGGSAAAPTCFITDVGLTQPFYASRADQFDYIVGPPAVPFFNNGTFPSNFAGYSPGFTTFKVTPVTGQYTLQVNVPAQNANPIGYTATATLSSAATLPAMGTPAITGKPANGLTGTVVVPAGVTETEVYVVDVNGNTGAQTFFTQVLTGTGTLNWTIPGNLGPCAGSNCQSGANATATFNTGDDVFVAAVGFDYPAFEAGPPGNTQQKPVITGANGQADVTLSPYTHTNY